MTSHVIRLFVYIRKSTDSEDKQIRSVEDQLAELTEFARLNNFHVTRTFIEKRSAKAPGRPIFNEMLSALQRREADGILAWHPDRLARNSVDGGQLIYLLDTKAISHLKFPTFWFENTAQGKLMLNLAFGQSKYYVDSLSDTVSRTIRQKFLRGEILHKAPVGYLNDKATRSAVPDPAKAELVKLAYELYATGAYSVSKVRDILHERGLRSRSGLKMTLQNMFNMLRNPFYMGLLHMFNEFQPGKHAAIIPKHLFDTVQDMLKYRRKRISKKERYFSLRGIMTCAECGCLVTAEVQKGTKYYRCSKRKRKCSQRYVREEHLESQMRDLIRRYSIPVAWGELALHEIENERRSSATALADWKAAQQEAIQLADGKLARLTNAYTSGALTLEEFRGPKNQLVAEKTGLREKIAHSVKTGETWFEPALDFIRRCNEATELASTGQIEDLRDFLQNVGSNFFLSERRVSLEPRQAWKTLTEQGFFRLANRSVQPVPEPQRVKMPSRAPM